MGRYEHVEHGFEPVYDENSRILILGTMPSVKSRENRFYYGHPQNRFWKVLASVLGEQVPETIEEKKDMLLRNGIAVWDVIESCDIIGSSDSSIRSVSPADIGGLLKSTSVSGVYVNGSQAEKLYNRYILEKTGIPCTKLPSTSPANARWTLEMLVSSWQVIREKL
ncbi:MAG: DNA-deoxyinosine glycosylase [Emergencia sp.]